MENMMRVSELIKTTREKAGISQRTLANEVNKKFNTTLSSGYLTDIENDRRNPSIEKVSQITSTLARLV